MNWLATTIFPVWPYPLKKDSLLAYGVSGTSGISKNTAQPYNALLLSGKLNGYLADIDRQAQEQMVTVIRQMSKAQGITEVLKATNQAEWVGMMNNICFAAVEMIHDEIIYA